MEDFFLSQERRNRLISDLTTEGLEPEDARRMAEFPPEDADDYLAAHATLMVRAARGLNNPEQAAVDMKLSAICFEIMTEEISERGMFSYQFPRSNVVMGGFVREQGPIKSSGVSLKEMFEDLKGNRKVH